MRSVIGRFGLATVALAAALAVGCGKDCSKDNTAPPQDSGSTDVTASVVKYPALEETVTKHKDKVVLVDFWATFCGPCVKKFPYVVELHEKYAAKGLVCVSVSLDDPADMPEVKKFLGQQRATFPNVLIKPTPAEEKQMGEKFGYDGTLPQMALFGKNGVRVWDSNSKPIREKELKNFAAKLEELVVAELGMSGPQVGATLPGPFEPLNLNGPDAGDESCLFCRYGNIPVVMVFASKPSEQVKKLVGEVEKAAAAAKGEVGACLVVTDTSAGTQKALKTFADDSKLKATIVSVIDAEKLKDYELAKDADVTVLIYSKRVVRINHTFKPGELTDKAIAAVAADATKHFAGK